MVELLLLVGAAVGIAAFIGGGNDDEASESESFSMGDDSVVDESFREQIQSGLSILVEEEGEITQDEADALLEEIEFRDGVLNIETGAGDDYVVAGAGDDHIETGEGDDFVAGGAGDDLVDMGSEDDVYGLDNRTVNRPDDQYPFGWPTDDATYWLDDTDDISNLGNVFEAGNDTILGGEGDDEISDSFGANVINGEQGADFIVTVDEEDGLVTPDTVHAGIGNDTVVVDEGDEVVLSRGQDVVVVELDQEPVEGYIAVRIEDFVPGQDRLELNSDELDLVRNGEGNAVTVEDLQDGSGASVFVDGVAVVTVFGGAGMTVGDLILS